MASRWAANSSTPAAAGTTVAPIHLMSAPLNERLHSTTAGVLSVPHGPVPVRLQVPPGRPHRRDAQRQQRDHAYPGPQRVGSGHKRGDRRQADKRHRDQHGVRGNTVHGVFTVNAHT